MVATPSTAQADVSLVVPNRRTEPLRVLVVGPLDGSGGMARVARMTTEGLDPDRFSVFCCDTAKDTPPQRSLLSACRSHVRRWLRLVGALRRHRPDLVHLHTCSYWTFYRTLLDVATCKVFLRPIVLHIHGGLFDEFLASRRGLARHMVVGALRRADRVIVLGKTWRIALSRLASRLNLAVVPNAVEPAFESTNDFQGMSAVPQTEPPEENPVVPVPQRGRGVLFVGDLGEVKRPEDLLTAWSALPGHVRERFPLTLVGTGSPDRRRRLRRLARRLGIQEETKFRGPLQHDEVRALMLQSDVLILPSRAEGMPLALLEAMRAALPSVTTRVGAIPELVTDGVEGFLVEPFDTLAISRRLRQLLEDEELRHRMGQAARARVERDCSLTAFHRTLQSIWAEIATERGLRHTSP